MRALLDFLFCSLPRVQKGKWGEFLNEFWVLLKQKFAGVLL
jgi:hypothetical protein